MLGCDEAVNTDSTTLFADCKTKCALKKKSLIQAEARVGVVQDNRKPEEKTWKRLALIERVKSFILQMTDCLFLYFVFICNNKRVFYA